MAVETNIPLYQKFVLPSETAPQDTGGYSEPKKPWNSYRTWAISPWHVRSVQLADYEKEIRQDPDFPDITYKARSMKGYPIHPVKLVFWETAKYGVQAYGLLDDSSLERVEKASLVMRQNGLETEKIIGKALVEKVKYGDEYIPIDDWRRLMIENPPVVTNPDDNNVTVLPEMIQKYLREAKFYTLLRELPIGERICDLTYAAKYIEPGACYQDEGDVLRLIKDGLPVTSVDEVISRQSDQIPAGLRNELAEILNLQRLFPNKRGVLNSGLLVSVLMDQVFNWHNDRTKRDLKKVDDNLEVIKWYMRPNRSSADFLHIEKYLFDMLPAKMGYYLAKFHALGLHHGFATHHNWFLIGGLGDLDSVGGAPLGDEPITEQLINRDLTYTGIALFSLAEKPNIKVRLPSGKNRTYQGYINQVFTTKNINYYSLGRLMGGYIVETARNRNELVRLDKYIDEGRIERGFLDDMYPYFKKDEFKESPSDGRYEALMYILKSFREVEQRALAP